MKGASTCSFLILLCSLASCVSLGRAFIISTKCRPPPPSRLRLQRGDSGGVVPSIRARGGSKRLAAVPAKKRRRRRQEDGTSDNDAAQESDSLLVGDELPDFDLGSTDDEQKQKSSARKVNPDQITSLMMGDANKAVRSVNELISDRSLERKFEFEEKGDPSIPDFTDLAKASTSWPSSSLNDGSPLGKKKMRQAERRADAIKTQAEGEREKNPLEGLPFVTNEAGKFSPIKLLESGGK
jgi:hypothetical protein